MDESSGQIILGIGIILLSVSAPICMVFLKAILTNGGGHRVEGMSRTECEAWRQGIVAQIVSLKAGFDELSRRVDNLSERRT